MRLTPILNVELLEPMGRMVVLAGQRIAWAGARTMTNSKPIEEMMLRRAALHQKILDATGNALKARYDDLLPAPLPQKILDLLARLERKEQRELS
jgi:Anti-sigma factor NepR